MRPKGPEVVVVWRDERGRGLAVVRKGRRDARMRVEYIFFFLFLLLLVVVVERGVVC